MNQQNHFADIFCQSTTVQKHVVDEILSEIISLEKTILNSYYEEMKENYAKSEKEFNFVKEIPTNTLSGIFKDFSDFNSLGIDIPVWYGDLSKEKKTTMLIGKDPKRNTKKNNLIVSTPFELANHSGRNTGKNEYWKFLSPILEENRNLYVTDIYKLYFEASESKIDAQKKYFTQEVHKVLLEKEIKFVEPDTIVTLGKHAKNAIIDILRLDEKKIQGTNLEEEIEGRKVTFHFVPHISRLNLQSVKVTADLFIALGKLKSDKELIEIGERIIELKTKLFD